MLTELQIHMHSHFCSYTRFVLFREVIGGHYDVLTTDMIKLSTFIFVLRKLIFALQSCLNDGEEWN